MKKFVLIIVGVFLSSFIFSQSLGARVYTGISISNNESKIITPSGTSHLGHHLGLDARLSNSKTSFLIGGQFSRVPFAASEGTHIFQKNNYVDYFKARLGFDVYIFPINDYFKIRSKVLGSYHKVFDYDADLLLAQGNGRIAESMLTGVVGIGMDIRSIIIDLEYEHGFKDAYDQIENSKFNAYSLSVGFHF